MLFSSWKKNITLKKNRSLVERLDLSQWLFHDFIGLDRWRNSDNTSSGGLSGCPKTSNGVYLLPLDRLIIMNEFVCLSIVYIYIYIEYIDLSICNMYCRDSYVCLRCGCADWFIQRQNTSPPTAARFTLGWVALFVYETICLLHESMDSTSFNKSEKNMCNRVGPKATPSHDFLMISWLRITHTHTHFLQTSRPRRPEKWKEWEYTSS